MRDSGIEVYLGRNESWAACEGIVRFAHGRGDVRVVILDSEWRNFTNHAEFEADCESQIARRAAIIAATDPTDPYHWGEFPRSDGVLHRRVVLFQLEDAAEAESE